MKPSQVYFSSSFGTSHKDKEALFEPRKPAFGVCDQVRRKPACSATETS